MDKFLPMALSRHDVGWARLYLWSAVRCESGRMGGWVIEKERGEKKRERKGERSHKHVE